MQSAIVYATRMGARAAEGFVATGCHRKCPFDLSDDAPETIKPLAKAWSVAFFAGLPKPRERRRNGGML